MGRRYNGDHALFWLGDPKLVLSSAPIADAGYLCNKWGYTGTQTGTPINPTSQLSLDILREKPLIESLVSYSDPQKTLRLIPYATTPEFLSLTDSLRRDYGLTVVLPESPTLNNLWLVNYLDSKVGFRTLVSQWLQKPDLLPFGIVCRDIKHAGQVVAWFRDNEQACVVKADQGGSGVGNLFLGIEELKSNPDPMELLSQNSFFRDDLFVVEEIITSSKMLSPSLEFYVPPIGGGEPEITYLSNQHFEHSGRFAGIFIDKDLQEEPWYADFEKSGLTISKRIQNMGYVGHFDLDSIVDDDNNLYLVEINARRTGGTYAHEFMEFVLGKNYRDEMIVFSQNKRSSGNIDSLEELTVKIEEILYPINSEKRGIIPTLTSALHLGYFGYLAVAKSHEEIQALRNSLAEMIDPKD
ncbi:MAG: hypothetical protein FVQ83_14235 [Chloroflexi bacterium]|nr:hypothetical protein [Chloroflexota bacterium]